MAENRGICGQAGGQGRETVCIDTYRVLDSSRDRDCYEDVRVYLTPFGQEIINGTCNVRVRGCEVAWCNVAIDPIQFNCGFYQLTVRYYILLTLESCMGQGRAQEFNGFAVLEKRSVLYGGEGDVKVYSSSEGSSSCNFNPRDAGNISPRRRGRDSRPGRPVRQGVRQELDERLLLLLLRPDPAGTDGELNRGSRRSRGREQAFRLARHLLGVAVAAPGAIAGQCVGLQCAG